MFTNGDLKTIRDKILDNKVAAPARAGAVAPLDVYVPAGNTGMEPGKTSFFQALGVPTKIARGTIEITADLKLVEAGGKVGASEATLLNMLNISPFTYGMKVLQVYEEGNSFSPDVLDIEESQLLKTLASAITTITAISLATNYPTLPSILHSLVNAYKNTIAVALETDFSWEGIEELKDRIANPDKYASSAPAATTATGGDDAAPAEAAEKEESEKEESDEEGKPQEYSMERKQKLIVQQVSEVFSTKLSHHESHDGRDVLCNDSQIDQCMTDDQQRDLKIAAHQVLISLQIECDHAVMPVLFPLTLYTRVVIGKSPTSFLFTSQFYMMINF